MQESPKTLKTGNMEDKKVFLYYEKEIIHRNISLESAYSC